MFFIVYGYFSKDCRSFVCEFNFKIKDRLIIRFGRFLVVNLSGLLISNLFLITFSGLMPYFELKVVSMPIVILFQFLMNYFWTFRKE